MKTTIFLVRHAETKDNYEDRIAGSMVDSDLTEKGIEQAKKLRERLAKEKFDAVYSSPLGRSMKTAKLANPNGLEIRQDQGLVEKGFGEIDGMIWDNVEKNWPGLKAKYIATGELPGVKGIEGFEESQERIHAALKKIAEDNPGKKILVFTHGTITRMLLSKLMDKNNAESMDIKIRNCAITVLNYENGSFKVKSINDDSFLTSS